MTEASDYHVKKRPATSTVTVAQLDQFDEIIDVRSEDEFAEDHIPGAVNYPVLNNAERAEVGTIYKQVSSFDAKKIGAALVSANIARHLREHLLQRPREWRPLVYCWRGGGRSGALAHVLGQIGWRAGQLEGGYKNYRRAVIADLQTLPSRLQWRVVCGMTGTGKSLLLRALRDQGAQVLDLEALAQHRGSVLGNLPDAPQPAQKMFESLVWHALRRFDPERPVFVESESKKIGNLRVPEKLIEAMWQSACVVIEAGMAVRVALLKDEYAHFLGDTALLNSQLDCLRQLHGGTVIDDWQTLARSESWDQLTVELLVRHYDPAYTRAIHSHYPRLPQARRFQLTAHTTAAMTQLARDVLAETPATVA
ncbi:MAG: tRNA 2-selenouridine(34) synthase MnmH [Burkholderiales bacterium]|nr:tRNA 2-selenouridine(34) synthase MnmH [Burkholderiales bacterium]